MLRRLRGHFGDRPETGKLLQFRDGGTVAPFCTVTNKKQGNTPMTWLLIVSRAADGSATAAVLYDERPRFGPSEPRDDPIVSEGMGIDWRRFAVRSK